MDVPWTVLRGVAAASVRHPRGFVVLGWHFSVGWPLLGLALIAAMAALSVADERARARKDVALLEYVGACLDGWQSALDGELTCEGALTSCVRVIGGEAACSCWLDDDGAVR